MTARPPGLDDGLFDGDEDWDEINGQIYDKLMPRLQESGMMPLYVEVERPLVRVLTDMEMTGISLDVDFLAEMSDRLGSRLVESPILLAFLPSICRFLLREELKMPSVATW